jgi:hypothetical protein
MSLTSERVFFIHPRKNPSLRLTDRVDQLLQDQRKTWKRLADGYVALKSARTRRITCDGYTVILQFNPERMASTTARVDQTSLRARRCFLCIENLPEEQRGIVYQDDFLILCNPAPIFDRHYTISHVSHREQSIEPFLGVMLSLARELSPLFTVFYNGPRSGASAPDHMHFQTSPSGILPVEQDSANPRHRVLAIQRKSISVWTLNDYARQVIVLESDNQLELETTIRRLLNAMREVAGEQSVEPLLNILCSYAEGTWKTIVFPRSKHRPDVFYREGADRILISPAAVDMGGFIVTPAEKDFDTVDGQLIQDIYREVSLELLTVEKIVNTLEGAMK